MRPLLHSFLLPLALAACGSVVSTDGGGTLPGPDGTFPDPLFNEAADARVETYGGYGFRVGQREEGGDFVAEAGVIPGSDFGGRASGTVTYTGEYEIVATSVAPPTDPTMIIAPLVAAGPMTLTADFAAGTVTGGGGGLVLDGTVSSIGVMGGGVTYSGIPGQLSGGIGSERAIGAFVGNDADTVYAGGFIVD